MIYEMRVYRCVPGGLPALLQRFEETTLGIWERLGIKQAGFFTTMIGESSNELTYFLAWESLDDRQRKWGAFATDNAWITARAAHQEKHGEVVANIASQFLAPTAFSAIK
tara:strand:- start:346 stop:675 length:330 start_codon:yes stop_codon:yes gene_type:complete